MAMVTARKGQHEVRVSRNSYETLFRKKGYRIVEDDDKIMKNVPELEKAEELKTEPKEKEVETIPISEMNKEQLAEYAKEHNIDTSAARNVREARQIIQKAIREQKM